MTTTTTNGRLARLLERHPLRRRILELGLEFEFIAGTGASPRELAYRIGGPSLGVVAYHVRTLAGAGALELVHEQRVRGAVEHFYRVTSAGRAALEGDRFVIAREALAVIAAGRDDARALAAATLERIGR